MKVRPTGITLIALGFLLLGALSAIWSLIQFGFGGFAWLTGAIFNATGTAAVGSSNFWTGLFGIAAAALQLAVGFGLLRMSSWAWTLALIAVGLTVVQGLLGLFSGGFFALCCGILGLIIPVVVLVYLLRPEIRSLF